MPNCFRLARKSDPEKTPMSLVKLDEELCKMLAMEVHPRQWCCGWYDVIGWAIAVEGFALGSETLRAYVKDMPEQFGGGLMEILFYLEQNFTSDAWYESKSSQG